MRTLLLIASISLCTTMTVAQDKEKAPAKAKIEFRWLLFKAEKGVTEEKGLQTTCGPELMYAKLKPVLTNADVAGTTLKHHDLSKNGLGKDQYSVTFDLTKDARKTLVKDLGEAVDGQLAIFVDGKYWGTGYFKSADAESFKPFAGLMTSKAEAERMVDACK